LLALDGAERTAQNASSKRLCEQGLRRGQSMSAHLR
jgi:hypothetical protein